MTGFGSFHPAVLFIYYVLALVFSMISMHPLLALASLCGSFLFYAFLNGGRKTLSVFFLRRYVCDHGGDQCDVCT